MDKTDQRGKTCRKREGRCDMNSYCCALSGKQRPHSAVRRSTAVCQPCGVKSAFCRNICVCPAKRRSKGGSARQKSAGSSRLRCLRPPAHCAQRRASPEARRRASCGKAFSRAARRCRARGRSEGSYRNKKAACQKSSSKKRQERLAGRPSGSSTASRR